MAGIAFIIESPGKIEHLRHIINALMPNEDVEILASFGHIRDLPERFDDDATGVEPPDFIPQYELSERADSFLKRTTALLRRGSRVVLATDPDREGEAISWHIAQALQLAPDTARVTFTAISEQAVTGSAAERNGQGT